MKYVKTEKGKFEAERNEREFEPREPIQVACGTSSVLSKSEIRNNSNFQPCYFLALLKHPSSAFLPAPAGPLLPLEFYPARLQVDIEYMYSIYAGL